MLCEVTDKLFHNNQKVLRELLLKCENPEYELSDESKSALSELRFLVDDKVPDNIRSHVEKNFTIDEDGRIRMKL